MTTAIAERLPRVAVQHVADIELPQEVEGLYELAYNLWWTWNPRASELFSTIDSRAWTIYHNPVQMLINVDRGHWQHQLANETFMDAYDRVIGELRAYVDGAADAWFWQQHPDYEAGPVAYFSMEYGIHQSLAIYSGGLGVLSGDHLKSASDLGLPLVAVGLLYGSRLLPADHRRRRPPAAHLPRLRLRPPAGAPGGRAHRPRPRSSACPSASARCRCRSGWRRSAACPCCCSTPTSPTTTPPTARSPACSTCRGARCAWRRRSCSASAACARSRPSASQPAVWHINEGHSALLQLERLGGLRRARQLGFEQAAASASRATTVFTTHTPVPAGQRAVRGRPRCAATSVPGPAGWACRGRRSARYAQGDRGTPTARFNLTALALRTARTRNGVSRIHASVSRRMWQPLFGAADPDAMPIDHVTNGVHLPTWIGREMQDLLRAPPGLPLAGARSTARTSPSASPPSPTRSCGRRTRRRSARLGRFTREPSARAVRASRPLARGAARGRVVLPTRER